MPHPVMTSSPRMPILLLFFLLVVLQATNAFVPPSVTGRHHHHHDKKPSAGPALRIPSSSSSDIVSSWSLPEFRSARQQALSQRISRRFSTTSSNPTGSGGGGTQPPQPTDPSNIEFSDDWKTMVEEGIPIDLEAILADAPILQNEHGTVFLDAFKRAPSSAHKNPLSFLQRLCGLGHRTEENIVEIKSGDWWRWTALQQQAFLETQLASSSSSSSSASSSASPGAPARSSIVKAGNKGETVAAPCLFRLRHPLPGLTSRLVYQPSTGGFSLAEKPWLETTQLYTWWLPLFVRVPLRLARPLYAPVFCLKWLGLRAMIFWRSFSQFILPSAPYLTLFSFRAIYMLAAFMLVTVALDELMRPVFEWTFHVLFRGKLPYPDLSYYSLETAAGKGAAAGQQSWKDRLWMMDSVK